MSSDKGKAFAVEAAKVFATFLATLLAIDVKLEWLRADVDRAHVRIEHVEMRVTQLEIENGPSRSVPRDQAHTSR